ncbi:DUF177 domain-containing protein [Pseudooceanicola sediminis]|uniref:DUF177 domain-containing protein n=1 Tax=Pseudooceanicola sediminis TaxID=2211117 RepID=A0A399J5R7_9RHOB|nr:DUF177 domain-containing protein [Pseudooceanicola sediminis]KAA2316831.1 DUF177 domain-containing protein [Puniceibacterium sp. HSS470]RII40711.1 DUF177 domain-containing protein [Pseudooceanicola sediminis]|tara:strand:+ start:184511 stop:185086 length:576 start_codon:yes stop_codon:yes gene_type:complete
MTDPTADALRVSTLSKTTATPFEVRPDAELLGQIAGRLELIGLRKLSFRGDVRADGKADWLLKGQLGATVVQPCSVTLEPVTTRIDQPVLRRFTPTLPDEEGDSDEIEMPEDETLEKLGTHIDPSSVMEEELALALPLYPRAEGVAPVEIAVTEPGRAPMTDEDAKPFAGLAGLMSELDPNAAKDDDDGKA